jgi:SPP1 gp7 family putative phage head morphogenesis protein
MTIPALLLATLDRLIEAFTAQRKWRALAPIERKLELAMQTAFRKQGRVFLAALNHRAGVLSGRLRESPGDLLPPDWEALFALIATDRVLFALPLEEAIEAALLAGGGHATADLAVDVAFDLANPRAAAYLEAHAAEAVTAINEATRAELRQVIAAGVREGQSYDQIARTIRERFAGFSTPAPQLHIRSRAHLVAVTESAAAYEQGNRAVADQLQAAGLQMEKSWLTVNDERVDPDCADNEGAGWIPLADTFPAGASEPPQHPACRCTSLQRRVPTAARVAA